MGFVIPIFIIVFAYIKIYSIVRIKKSIKNTSTLEINSINNISISFSPMSVINQVSINQINKTISHNLLNIQSITKNDLTGNESIEFSSLNTFSRLNERRNAIKTDLIYIKPKNFQLEREIRVAKMILVKIVLFCVAWKPYVVVILLTQFGTNIEEYITPKTTSLPSLFAKSSIIFNALVYTLSQKDCRTFYRKKIFS